ncbi:MAG: hypothetical protein RL557_125 [archaeon]|jgi:hypothetical protein
MIPVEKFVRIESDEGEVVEGFSTETVYNDCHKSTCNGTRVVVFPYGFPVAKYVYDFDVREQKDGLHVSHESQVSVQGIEKGFAQVLSVKNNIEDRLDKSEKNSLAPFLLDEYLDTICHLERALVDENLKTFSTILSSLGTRNSRKFIGYQSTGNPSEFGVNGALLFPEANSLVGVITRNAVSREQCDTAYNILNSTQFEFWPVASLPFGICVLG